MFKKLNPNETRIFLQRHGAHKKNILDDEASANNAETGKMLVASGVNLVAAYSSPAPRALQTSLHTQQAMGVMVATKTVDGLSDMSVEDPSILKDLISKVDERGLKGDPGIAEVAFDTKEDFLPLMSSRALRGAEALLNIASAHVGETVLATSHGVARIEISIQAMKGEQTHLPAKLLEMGHLIELIVVDGKITEENWI